MLTLVLPLIILPLLIIYISARVIWISSTIAFFFLALVAFTSVSSPIGTIGVMSAFQDLLSLQLIVITLWLSGLIIITSQKILFNLNRSASFIIAVTRLTLILVLAFSTSSIFTFYIFFEASLIPTFLLVLGWGYQPERLQASIYLVLYTVAASLPLLLSLVKIFKISGHLNLCLDIWLYPLSHNLSTTWWLITIAAFLVKTPIFLTHLWLPKAHVEAPVAGSIVLAGVLLKLGRYGIIRIATKYIWLNKLIAPAIISICLVGGVIAGLICIRQTDVKALIAYSSVRHMGLATAGIISNTSWGWQGAFIMLLAHGLCSSCIFSLANITYETISSRRIYITKGIAALFPSLSFWWFALSACNIAAPPSINLGAEIILISGTISTSSINLIPLSLIAFLAAAYSLFLYTSTQHGTPASFNNPLSLFCPRNYTICMAHFLPLILLVFKADLVTSWV